jgi:hypothetical protein
MVVDDLKFSKQLLHGVLVLLLILRAFVVQLLVDLEKERM